MRHWKSLLGVCVLFVSCKKLFNPTVISSPKSYLVVEGTISTNDTTTIKLSKTVRLDTNTTTNPITHASLVIECDNGAKFNLTETRNGVYQLAAAGLDNSRKFRLRITTADSKEYVSDYEQAKNTPAIDSVGFTAANNKLQLYVSTHDPAKSTRYYRFDYTETWKFHVRYNSEWVFRDLAVRARRPEDLIYYCFGNNRSSTIVLGSTIKLTEDILYQYPLTQVRASEEKLELRYSIIVHEYGLSDVEYKFWENLKKNTEQLGSIFDAEPTQLKGNIHSVTDPSELVIGYVGAGKVSSKRIFIGREQLPDEWTTNYPYDCATPDTFYYSHPRTGENQVKNYIENGLWVPINAIYGSGGRPVAYSVTNEAPCVDCTTRGVTKQPDFWK